MSYRESSNSLPSEIPLLDGSNYCHWERAMKVFLQTKELFKLIRDTYTEPLLLSEAELIQYNSDATPEATITLLQRKVDLHAEWEDNNERILGYITLKISAPIQQIMANVTNARTLWNNLATNYGMTRSAGIFMDFQAVTDWKFDDRKDPQTSINELLARINRLTADGLTLPNNIQAMILLKAVPRNWDNFAGMILATTAASDLTTARITPLIQEEWIRCNPQAVAQLSRQQLQQGAQPAPWQSTHGTFRGRVCGHGRGHGRGGRGRPYQRPAEPAPTGSGNAPLLPQQQQQWPGQMAGQQHGPNAERNRAQRQEQNARKRAFQATGGVHMAHMVVDDNDPRTDQQKEEDLIDENWEPEVFLSKYKIGSPKPKMVPPPKEREPSYLAHRKSVADFAAKK